MSDQTIGSSQLDQWKVALNETAGIFTTEMLNSESTWAREFSA
jgi:hypothetical protein